MREDLNNVAHFCKDVLFFSELVVQQPSINSPFSAPFRDKEYFPDLTSVNKNCFVGRFHYDMNNFKKNLTFTSTLDPVTIEFFPNGIEISSNSANSEN